MKLSLMRITRVYDLMLEVAALDEEEIQLLAEGLFSKSKDKADSLQFALETQFHDDAHYCSETR